MALAIRSGIPVPVWLDGDPEDLETALLLTARESEDT